MANEDHEPRFYDKTDEYDDRRQAVPAPEDLGAWRNHDGATWHWLTGPIFAFLVTKDTSWKEEPGGLAVTVRAFKVEDVQKISDEYAYKSGARTQLLAKFQGLCDHDAEVTALAWLNHFHRQLTLVAPGETQGPPIIGNYGRRKTDAATEARPAPPIRPDDIGQFVECDACRAKPGSPPLCQGCLHNRALIESLPKLNQLYLPFLQAMNEIGDYGHEKYFDTSWQAQRDAGTRVRLVQRLETVALLDHARTHIKQYLMNEPHDRFGTIGKQLAAAAYNLMMEFFFANLKEEKPDA